MRTIKHYLQEAKLQPKDFYQKKRLVTLIDKLEQGDSFQTLDGDQIQIKATSQEIKVLKSLLKYYDAGGAWPDAKDFIPRTIGGIKLSTLFKGSEFGGQGGQIGTTDTGSAVKANIGETVEALKSAAIFTKLVNRTKDSISAEDVLSVIGAIAKNAQDTGKIITSTVALDVPDSAGNIKDNISLVIDLKRAPFQRAVAVSPEDKDAWGRLSSIINYINTESDLAKYSRFFANNQHRDPVNIVVRGIEGAKADVETTYVDDQGVSRPLRHLSMSIKAGSAKYDQASGLNEAGNIKFFNILGLSIDDARAAMKQAGFSNDLTLEPRIEAVVKLYSLAANDLANKVNSLNDNGEATFIQTLLANLKKSIRGDQRLVYVNFDANGTYYKLNPELIGNLAEFVDLKVNLVTKKWPYIYVTDAITGTSLFHARLQVNSSGRLTHIFELDGLIDMVKRATQAKNIKTQEPVAESIIINPPRQRR
jgi:hypothetical protein